MKINRLVIIGCARAFSLSKIDYRSDKNYMIILVNHTKNEKTIFFIHHATKVIQN